jgi:hypothetical protein
VTIGADAMLFGAAIGPALVLVLSVPVTVLYRRVLRGRGRSEVEIKALWFSYHLSIDTREPGDRES